MKKILLIVQIILSINSFAQSDEGKILKYKFESDYFDKEREIKIFLPVEYELEPEMKFSVIYFFDSQNETLFNLAKSTIDFLIASSEMEPAILIGISTQNRHYEFLPDNENKETLKRYRKVGGANNLANSIEKEIFPYMQDNFRVNDSRIGIGHSLGATFIVYSLTTNRNLFNSSILISPNLVYDNYQLLNQMDKITQSVVKNDNHIYAISGNMGSYENEFNPAIKTMDSVFNSANLTKDQWSYSLVNNYNHSTILLQGIHKGLIDYSGKFEISTINKNGYQFIESNNFNKALETFKRGTKLFPDDSNIHDSYGDALELSGNMQEAEKQYSLALKKIENEAWKYSKKEIKSRQKMYSNNLERVQKQLSTTTHQK